jgi:hypothetical protein
MPRDSGPAAALPANAARSCGECGLCCKLLAVDEIGKPAHVWCEHFSPGTGCTIYETRPAACRTFECLWLKQTELSVEWQPTREPFHSTLRSWAARGLAEGLQLVVKIGGRVVVVLPDRDVDLGTVGEGHRIVLSRITTPEGVGLVAKVVPED